MTEDVSKKFKGFDEWPVRGMVDAMYEGQIEAMNSIRPALGDIAKAAEAAAKRLGTNGRLIYVGAGTSGRIAVQDGAELGPTFGWPLERCVFCLAGGMGALTISAEGAEDVLENGRTVIEDNNITREDVVLGIAASGRTPYTLGALEEANARGALTIGIANNAGTPILQEALHGILTKTGSEIIAGSTRMKAGTTQKVILNMLSTAIMAKRGHVYDGLMVDMIVSNKKLENRAINMVCDITKCSKEISIEALKQAENNIKLASLIVRGENVQSGLGILENASGNLRLALSTIPDV